jgi:hypothetical protein
LGEFRRLVDGTPDLSGKDLTKFELEMAKKYNLSRKATANSVLSQRNSFARQRALISSQPALNYEETKRGSNLMLPQIGKTIS